MQLHGLYINSSIIDEEAIMETNFYRFGVYDALYSLTLIMSPLLIEHLDIVT
jgi:hypothetical protein